MGDSIFKKPALMGHLVKKLEEKNSDKQIGNSYIQKMLFLLTRENIVDFDYSMNSYGPHSNEVSGELSFAEDTGIICSTWDPNKGYFIRSAPQLEEFESFLHEDEKQAIEKLVETYSDFMTKDLSIITTALFLKDDLGIQNEELVEKVHNFKEKVSPDHIQKLLQETGIITK
ncbi:MAG: hypothetical protein KAW47_09025 [Thermoplasmatales archaeon]|nr:hypothetical protein [Thermoplasmatales archaeon]